MFERFQTYPKYTIDDRKGMHVVNTLNSATCEKRFGEETHDVRVSNL